MIANYAYNQADVTSEGVYASGPRFAPVAYPPQPDHEVTMDLPQWLQGYGHVYPHLIAEFLGLYLSGEVVLWKYSLEVTFTKEGITQRNLFPCTYLYADNENDRLGKLKIAYLDNDLSGQYDFCATPPYFYYLYFLHPEEKLAYNIYVYPATQELWIDGQLAATRTKPENQIHYDNVIYLFEHYGLGYEPCTWFCQNPRDGSWLFSCRHRVLYPGDTRRGLVDSFWNAASGGQTFEQLTGASGDGLLAYPINLY